MLDTYFKLLNTNLLLNLKVGKLSTRKAIFTNIKFFADCVFLNDVTNEFKILFESKLKRNNVTNEYFTVNRVLIKYTLQNICYKKAQF